MPRKKTNNMTAAVTPRFILFFDTETTGLLPKNEGDPIPHIIQLSFILYDVQTNMVIEKFDEYVRVGKEVAISEEVTRITGITREKCDRGVAIEKCLYAFRDCYKRADLLVAHNIQFDMAVIRCEIQRFVSVLFKFEESIDDAMDFVNMFKRDKRTYCTMMKNVKLCDIRATPESKYPKYPKLTELYGKLYTTESLPTTMHNSMTDVLVCMRCYMKITGTREIEEDEFKTMLNDCCVY